MSEERRSSFRDVFAVGEFRALLAAQFLSTAGDQVARVALAVLVFADTRSPALAAVSVALTYVPELVGGPLLSGLADRHPRRDVMVACDVVRAVLIAAAAIPGLPLPVLWLLVFLVQTATAPARAARSANMPAMLGGDRYPMGLAVMTTAAQIAYVGGFALGGALVTAVGPHAALLVDAATFTVSAVLIRLAVVQRPASGREGVSMVRSARAGLRLIRDDPRLRALTALAWLYGFYIAPPRARGPVCGPDRSGGVRRGPAHGRRAGRCRGGRAAAHPPRFAGDAVPPARSADRADRCAAGRDGVRAAGGGVAGAASRVRAVRRLSDGGQRALRPHGAG